MKQFQIKYITLTQDAKKDLLTSINQVLFILDNGVEVSGMGQELKDGLMELSILEIGKIVRHMAKANF